MDFLSIPCEIYVPKNGLDVSGQESNIFYAIEEGKLN